MLSLYRSLLRDVISRLRPQLVKDISIEFLHVESHMSVMDHGWPSCSEPTPT